MKKTFFFENINILMGPNIEVTKDNLLIVDGKIKAFGKEAKEEAFKRITALQEANAEAREEVDNLKSKFDKHNMNVLSLRKPKLSENIINRGTKEVLNELENITNPASSNM